jgi:hypothetical protein
MLAKILAVRHGFKCTVLFSINPTNGAIDPNTQTNIPGMAALDSADLFVMLLRFREMPDADMKHFVDYFNRGKPIIALRTSTHAFAYDRNRQSAYARFDWRNKEWPGGFGQQVLGDTWVNHHGSHGKESTRGVINEEFKAHPLLRGVNDIWDPGDVYGVAHLPSHAKVLVRAGAQRDEADRPARRGQENDPEYRWSGCGITLAKVVKPQGHHHDDGRSSGFGE